MVYFYYFYFVIIRYWQQKIICKAEHGTSADGNFVIRYNNKEYSNFKKVEHNPTNANTIFLQIHRSGNRRFSDCLPPVITTVSQDIIHRLNGITLNSWFQYKSQSDLVYPFQAGSSLQLTDKFKLLIQ